MSKGILDLILELPSFEEELGAISNGFSFHARFRLAHKPGNAHGASRFSVETRSLLRPRGVQSLLPCLSLNGRCQLAVGLFTSCFRACVTEAPLVHTTLSLEVVHEHTVFTLAAYLLVFSQENIWHRSISAQASWLDRFVRSGRHC